MSQLSGYGSVGTVFAVKIDYETADRISQTVTFTDYYAPIEIGGVTYTGIGNLLSISETEVELRAVPSEVTVTISGLGEIGVNDIFTNRYKGGQIEVTRVFVDAKTLEVLDIPANPAGRFKGLITNISLNEDFDRDDATSTNTIGFICSSEVALINRKVTGRKTNSVEQRKFFPNDSSMDRVANIANSNFNFGAPQ